MKCLKKGIAPCEQHPLIMNSLIKMIIKTKHLKDGFGIVYFPHKADS